MSVSGIPDVEWFNVVYLSVVDMHADTSEGMEAVVSNLHKEYGIGRTSNYLVVVKTFARLQELKHAYGSDYSF